MAKVTIAELDLDTSKLVQSAADTKKAIQDLSDAQKVLKIQGGQNTKEFVKNEVALKKLQKTYREQTKVIGELNLESQKELQLSKQITTATSKQVKSIDQARKNNKELLAIRNKLNITTASGQKELTKINAKLDQNNKFIKENVDQYTKQKINIGNYESALRSVSPQMSRIINNLQMIRGALIAQREAQIASTTATNFASKSLRLFKIALISTGIGAIVVALGSLITFLTTTQKGIDQVTKVTKPLQVIFQSLLGVLQKVGEGLFDAFSNPKEAINDLWKLIKENIVNRIKGLADTFGALGRVIKATFTLDFDEAKEALGDLGESITQTITGVDNLPDKLKKLGNEAKNFFDEAIDKGQRLREIAIEIEQKESEMVLRSSEITNAIKEQELIAKDRTKSDVERAAAVQKALELSRELAGAQKEILNLKIEEETINQSLSDSGREDLKKLNELKAQQIAEDEKQKTTELRFIGTKAQLENEAIARNQKIVDAKIKAMEEEFALFQEQNRFREADAQLNANKELEILQAKLDAKKISETKYQEEKLAIENELFTKQIEKEEAELERIANFEQRKTDLQNEIDLANAATQEERELLKVEQEFERHVAELEQLQLNSEEKQELLELLTTQEEQIVADIKAKAAADAAKVQLKVDKEVLAQDKRNADARAAVASALTGILKGLLGDSLGAKLASIAIEAAIQAGLVAINSSAAQATNLAAAATVGPPPVTAAMMAAAAGQNAAIATNSSAAITKIVTSAALQGIGTLVSNKFYEGGQVPTGTGGRIRGQNIPTQRGGDNILATVKSGEVILNEQQQQRAGGSAFFKSIGVPGFQTGGVVPPSNLSAPIAQGQLNQSAINDLASQINDIQTVLVVEDVSDLQGQQVEVIEEANI